MQVLLTYLLCSASFTVSLSEWLPVSYTHLVAYYYEVTTDEADKVDATFDKDKNTIIAKKEGKMTIKIHYLPVSGTAASADVELPEVKN